MLEERGSLPERINFAIPINEAQQMVRKAHAFTQSAGRDVLSPSKIFEMSNGATVLITAIRSEQTPLPAEPTVPQEQRPTPTAKSTATPARNYNDRKWPDEWMLIHPEHFVKARVINVAPDDTLKLRSGPGTRFDSVTEIPPNAMDITAFDQDLRFDGDTFWYPVEWHGFLGYVGRKYISADH